MQSGQECRFLILTNSSIVSVARELFYCMLLATSRINAKMVDCQMSLSLSFTGPDNELACHKEVHRYIAKLKWLFQFEPIDFWFT